MRTGLACVCVAVLLGLLLPARADRNGDGMTLDQFLPEIRAAHPGQLSDAHRWTGSNGQPYFRVKWLTPEGRILLFDVDSSTGRYSQSADDFDVKPRDIDRPRFESGPHY